jgi:hypothetical protein
MRIYAVNISDELQLAGHELAQAKAEHANDLGAFRNRLEDAYDALLILEDDTDLKLNDHQALLMKIARARINAVRVDMMLSIRKIHGETK